MLPSRLRETGNRQQLLAGVVSKWWLCLLLLPLAIGLFWGGYLAAETYLTLRYAQALAAGTEVQTQVELTSVPAAPLYVGMLASAAAAGLPIAPFSLWLSTIGWGILALTLAALYRELDRPLAAVALPLLLVLSPWLVATLGSELPWFLAVSWLAIWLGLRRQWPWQAVALLALPSIHFSVQSIGLALLLLGQQALERRRIPWLALLLLTLPLAAWSAAHFTLLPMGVWPLLAVEIEPGQWQRAAGQLIAESNLYWLGLPLVAIGLAQARRTWIILPWLALALLSGGTAAIITTATILLFIAGLGMEAIVQWLMVRARFQLALPLARAGLVAALTLPLALAHLSSLAVRYQQRPVALTALEKRAGAWLQQHSAADTLILGSWQMGVLANRPALSWNGRPGEADDLARLVRTLSTNRPHYVVSDRSLAWQTVTHLGWFQEHYRPVQRYVSPSEAISPLTIWAYRPPPVVSTEIHPINLQLANGAHLLGYQYWPARIHPGDAVQVVLHWQAPQPIALAFNSVVWLASPVDGTGWAQRDELTPRTVPPEWWAPGQIVTERFVLTTTQQIPVGGYQLNVAFRPQDTTERIPIYRDGDTNPLDRVQLAYIAVPWPGDVGTATPVQATFGDAITLRAADLPTPNSAAPGETVSFTLYWEGAASRPTPVDYNVFVHLIDSTGQLVATGDGPPRGGSYPTGAWLAGDIVPDERRLVLPPALPPGDYQVRVGLYRPQTGERLPVRQADNSSPGADSLLLLTLSVTDEDRK